MSQPKVPNPIRVWIRFSWNIKPSVLTRALTPVSYKGLKEKSVRGKKESDLAAGAPLGFGLCCRSNFISSSSGLKGKSRRRKRKRRQTMYYACIVCPAAAAAAEL